MTAVPALAVTLPEEVLDQLTDRLAEAIAARLTNHLAGAGPDEWLDTERAAAHLGLPSVDALHRLTAARAVAFSQERSGAKCYFRRHDLDAYREAHMRGAVR